MCKTRNERRNNFQRFSRPKLQRTDGFDDYLPSSSCIDIKSDSEEEEEYIEQEIKNLNNDISMLKFRRFKKYDRLNTIRKRRAVKQSVQATKKKTKEQFFAFRKYHRGKLAHMFNTIKETKEREEFERLGEPICGCLERRSFGRRNN